jgi:dienelactone hydrolase
MPAGRPVTYSDAGTALTGVLYGVEASHGELPGILLIHGGAGLDAHAREQAERWAGMGYVVFAGDMYGDGVAGDRQRVMACLTALRDDPALLAGRAEAALDQLRPETGGRLAAIGYCFGGMAALTLARAGSELAAAISIHGSLATPSPARPGAVRARVLACHGASDPHVPMEQVAAFAREMDDARADWQLTMYGGAVHGFTHRHATPGATPGVAYDERADSRSFADANRFMAQALGADPGNPIRPQGGTAR